MTEVTARPRTQWSEARSLFEMARSDANAFCDLSDAECDLFANAQYEATLALLTCEAPDTEASAFKLEVFRDEEMFGLERDLVREIHTLIAADARRLGAGE